MLAAVRSFDAADCGHVDWRELAAALLAAARPAVHAAPPEALARAACALAAADCDGDGLLTEEEWAGVDLWFTEPTPAELDAADAAAQGGEPARAPGAGRQPQAAAAPTLKRLLWSLFATPCAPAAGSAAAEDPPATAAGQQQQQEAAAAQQQALGEQQGGAPKLQWEAMLLYLCPDRDLSTGVQKALAAATRDASPSVLAPAAAVARMCWPLLGPAAGAPLQGAPLSEAQVAAAVRAAEDAAAARAAPPAAAPAAGAGAPAGLSAGAPAVRAAGGVRAQDLLTSPACERMARLLLRRYLLADIYIACRL